MKETSASQTKGNDGKRLMKEMITSVKLEDIMKKPKPKLTEEEKAVVKHVTER